MEQWSWGWGGGWLFYLLTSTSFDSSYIVIAHIVMAFIVMAHIAMAHAVMAYVVMAVLPVDIDTVRQQHTDEIEVLGFDCEHLSTRNG